jgi:phosphoenolpyruvate carboxylase
LQSMSIAERAMPLSPAFKEALANALAHPECTRIAQRNSGEPYRQFLFCMLRKLQLAIARIEGGHAFGAAGYANADELLADLRTLEDALIEGGADDLAKDLVRPVRWSVEIFRFRTVRLDLRENTTRLTQTLQALWQASAGQNGGTPPDPASAAWKKWIIAELARPFPATRTRLDLPPEAQETLGMFELASDKAKEFDREAFGCFILSMTRSVADVLGAYLLAKHAGLFLDAAGVETCTLPIVPLFETIADLRAAPGIMRELLSMPVVRRSARAQGGVQEVMRISLLELEIGEGADPADQDRQRKRHSDRVFPWPGRLGQPRRRSGRAGGRGTARRLDQWGLPGDRTRRGRLIQIRQSRYRSLSDGSPRECRTSARPHIGARAGAGAEGRIR